MDREATFKSATALIQLDQMLDIVFSALIDEVQCSSDVHSMTVKDPDSTRKNDGEAISKHRDGASEVRIPITEEEDDANCTSSNDEPSRSDHITALKIHPALEKLSLADFLRAVSWQQSGLAKLPNMAPPLRRAPPAIRHQGRCFRSSRPL
jgi:hypothetical protein